MSRHVQNTDTAVLERRIRPIYEFLENGNNKRALQECEKVLRKSPNLSCAKALKALIYHRMGRQSECDLLLAALCSENPVDEATLQPMAMCYREMRQMDKVRELYERAVATNPTNEELRTQLFMTFVRMNEYNLQQQSAMALYRLKPKNPYYCWNVMSIVLQATRGDGKTDLNRRAVLLTLAERMMKKLYDENKIEAEQEVQLYILVLNLEEKYEEILEMLDGPLGEKLTSYSLPQVKMEYVIKLKNWERLNSLCKYLLNESFDRWEVWKQYINSVLELAAGSSSAQGTAGSSSPQGGESPDNIDNSPEKCHEFICSMIESGADNQFLLRGPYLARFELCARMRERNMDAREIVGDTAELFIEYFRKFGHKPCCVYDLKIYLHLLDDAQQIDLGMRTITEVGVRTGTTPATLEQMQRHIGAIQLYHLCGGHQRAPPQLLDVVTNLVTHQMLGYQAYGMDLPPTELSPSDNYVILASHIMYRISSVPGFRHHLVAAAVVLEKLLDDYSKRNFHAKLLMVKFYHLLGNGLGAEKAYRSLDLKHLQLDSLGYLHCEQLATTGLFSLCSYHIDNSLKFFSCSYKDIADNLTHAYKFGSFIKVDEFMDFRERMINSMHYTTVVIDRIMLNLVDCFSIDNLFHLDISVRENKFEWDKLRDNRDLEVFHCWEPEFASQSIFKSEVVKESFAQDVSFLKLRCHILWALGAAINAVKTVGSERDDHVNSLVQVLGAWKELEDQIRSSDPQPTSQETVLYPPVSRLHGYLNTPYGTCLSSLFEFLVHFCRSDLDGAEARLPIVEKEVESLVDTLRAKILIPIEPFETFQQKRKGTELFVNTLEVICVGCIICMLSSELAKAPLSKKGKKKLLPAEVKTREIQSQVVELFKTELKKMSDLLVTWTSIGTRNDLADAVQKFTLVRNVGSILQRVTDSNAEAFKEIQGVINNKVRVLNSLC